MFEPPQTLSRIAHPMSYQSVRPQAGFRDQQTNLILASQRRHAQKRMPKAAIVDQRGRTTPHLMGCHRIHSQSRRAHERDEEGNLDERAAHDGAQAIPDEVPRAPVLLYPGLLGGRALFFVEMLALGGEKAGGRVGAVIEVKPGTGTVLACSKGRL